MYEPTVELLNSMTAQEQADMVEILRAKAFIGDDEKLTLKELFIENFGEDEVTVYEKLSDLVRVIRKLSNS